MITATEKGRDLDRRISLENPCVPNTEEWNIWITWVMSAIFGNAAPTAHDIPAAHEGYAWGKKFNKEWDAAHPVDACRRCGQTPIFDKADWLCEQCCFEVDAEPEDFEDEGVDFPSELDDNYYTLRLEPGDRK